MFIMVQHDLQSLIESLRQSIPVQENLFTAMHVLLLVVTIVLFAILSKLRRIRKPYPPGPTGLPLIGNMMMMDQLTHHGLARLAQTYGPIFHLKLGFEHKVVVSGPEEARQVLQVHDSIFSNRPTNIAMRYLSYNRANMAFANYGQFWRQMRKLCVMRLFSRKRAETWLAVQDETTRLIRAVSSQVGSPVNVGEMAFKLAKNVTYRAAFGSGSTEGQDEFIAIIQEFSKLFAEFNIADFIPFFKWADPSRLNRRLAKARRSLDAFIDQIIDDHIENKKRNDQTVKKEEDMVDDMLNFYNVETQNNDSYDHHKDISLTRDNIKAIIMDVMFGGTETVATSIEWTMAELLRKPDYLKRVQQELTDLIGPTRRVEKSDLDKLTFFKCCIKETLRLHPPIPLLLHETAEEATIGSYYIPKQTRVLINAYAIGRDPSSWSDPDSFKPDRFLKEGVPDFKGGNFEFIPFGSGRRSCPGMQLGLYGLEMCVASLLHCFKWDLPDGMKPSELVMDDVFGLTAPRASRLIAVASPRLLCPLR